MSLVVNNEISILAEHIAGELNKHDGGREWTAEKIISRALRELADHLVFTPQLVHCAREDCHAVFSIISRHKRKYCSQKCAHHAAVRRSRTRTKTEGRVQ